MEKRQEFLASRLQSRERKIRAIYISTYLPRKCGIASFTKDLTNAINLLNPNKLAEILAVTKNGEEFPWEVKYKIKESDLRTYLDAANYINESSADLVVLQHEFGIFGGDDGQNILELTTQIKKPLITTLHTVLSKPSDNQLRIIKKLASQSEAVVVMVESARDRLINIFGIDPTKIVVIHHGVPDIPYGSEVFYKEEIGLEKNQPVIAAINLLSENKGIEYVLEALPSLVKKFPNLMYLIIGQTHPEILKQVGEKYRDYLKSIVIKHKLEKNVKFINEYVSLEDLITYLRATDIYITPYLDPEQTSSGTLAYALGAGKVCISTDYLYAREVLADGRGVIIPFRDSGAISKAVEEVLVNEEVRERYKKAAYQFGRLMIWPQVALNYLDLMQLVLQKEKKEVEVEIAN